MNTQLLLIHCLSPLHAGTGQSSGAIDLAVARDRATGYPLLPGSSLKGSLRAVAHDEEFIHTIFGPPQQNASDHAGALSVGDATLLAFPARSVRGTFAYVTSPYLLTRLQRDVAAAKLAGFEGLTVPTLSEAECMKASDTIVLNKDDKKFVVFEDLDLQASGVETAKDWAKAMAEHLPLKEGAKKSIQDRLCIVHDDVLAFLTEYAMDVTTRTALEAETKTVKKGQLWTEENLPSETLLLSVVAMASSRKRDERLSGGELMKKLRALIQKQGAFSLGGNTTVGRGRSHLTLTGGGA